MDFNLLFNEMECPFVIQMQTFFSKFTKHLHPDIAARVLWTLNKILDSQKARINEAQIADILQIGETEIGPQLMKKVWFGSSEPAKNIISCFKEYQNLIAPNKNNDNDNILDEVLDTHMISSE